MALSIIFQGCSRANYHVFMLFCKGGDDEIIFTWWSSDKPNNIDYQCVCVKSNGNPAWSWTDCNCTQPRQFVCLKSRKNLLNSI